MGTNALSVATPGQDIPADHHNDSAQDDGQIFPQSDLAGVDAVHFGAVVESAVVALGNLPEAGEAGTHTPVDLVGIVDGDLFGQHRTRADQAHIAGEDVPQLRQLVERGDAQDAADAGDARVALEHRTARTR